MNFLSITALLLTNLLALTPLCQPLLDNSCSQPETHRFLVVSQAKIEKSKYLQYSLTLLDSPVKLNKTKDGLIFSGNFTILTLKNTNTKKETIYYGVQMRIKMPANHVFNLAKIPDLQIQINHRLQNLQDPSAPIPYIMLAQTYMVSQFSSSINTILSKNINKDIKDGDIIKTSEIVTILDGFPMLMYRGSAQSYPCRSDLLCLLKREYQLISADDLVQLKLFINQQPQDPKKPKKAFKRKNLQQIHPMKRYNPPVREYPKKNQAKSSQNDEQL